HGLKATILLTKDSQSEKVITEGVFQNLGTPSAYLLNDEGKVAHRVVVGTTANVEMAQEAIAAHKLTGTKIERTGIKAGTPAPAFALPDINSGTDATVTLEQFRGRKVLLVFSDPHCGPCDALAPDLVKLHRKHRDNGMAVVLVGRGDPEENKKKAVQYQM